MVVAEKTGYCKCHEGYWGSECQNECPGGATDSCYGNGVCDFTTGSCSCHTGSSLNTSCEQCEAGWFGTDCSIVYVDNDNTGSGQYLGKSYHSGHFITFDGSVYNYHYPGEHLLVSGQLLSGIQIKVHVLQVFMSEYYSSVGTSAVGIQINSHKLVISVIDENVSTWYDDETVVIGSGFEAVSGVTCKQVSSFQYQVSAGSDLVIDIYIYENHLDIHIGAVASFCGTSTGLLSSCNLNHLDDFKTRTGVVLTSTGTLNTNTLHSDFGQSWLVSDSNSVFKGLVPIENSGGFGLSTNGSHIITDPVSTFTEFVVTIEIKFKADIVSPNCHTIWSYKKDNNIFSTVVCNGQITLYYQDKKITFSSITVDVDTWYHFAIVWRLDTRVISLYLVQEGLQINTDVHVLDVNDHNPLTPGGTFMIGQWNYPTNERDGVNWGFIGTFDDFRIWKKQLTLNQIRSYAFKHMTDTYTGLTNHWNFNMGYDRLLTDYIGGLKITMISSPWNFPVWTLVDYSLSTLSLNIYQVFTNPNNVDVEIEEFCKSVVLSSVYNNACTDFGTQIQVYVYKQCIFNSKITNSQDWTMEPIITLSDHCSLNRELVTWPARAWCGSFTSRHFPRWSGSSCSTPCVSGELSTTCNCDGGFWGSHCQSICPYSADLPCGGGTCFSNNGTCSCLSNFAGDNCDACATGWYGADCSVSVASIPSSGVTTKVCSVFGYSHFSLFDGQTFDMTATGEFLFIQDPTLFAYVRQLPCGENGAVCVKQIWIQTQGQNLTVVSSAPGEDGILLLHNSQPIVLDNMHNLTSTVRVVQKGQTSINVEYGSNILTINYHSLFLEVFAKLTQCTTGMSGLCGTCDYNKDNDFVISSGSTVSMTDITHNTINTNYADYWRMGTNVGSGFKYEFDGLTEPQNTNGNTFVLAFNGAGAYTSQLEDMFGNNGDATIQVKFAANSATGLILAYYKQTSVSIYLNGTVHILWGDVKIDTYYTAQIDVWYQVSLTYTHSTNNLKIYILTNSGMQWWKQLTVQTNALISGGIFKVGDWKENAPIVFQHFDGRISEIQTWKTALDIYQIMYTSKTLLSKQFTDLTSLWIFSKGYSYIALDIIYNYQLILPSEDVYWWPSNVVTDGDHPTTPENETLRVVSERKCREYFMESTIPSICGQLGEAVLQFYYKSCVRDMMSSSNELGYIYSVVSYIEYCEIIVNPPTSPRGAICLDGTNPYFNLLCSHLCKFGKLNTEMVCECDKGYWDTDCSQVCTGGTLSPCSDNGLCIKETGQCYCYPSYSNETDCKTCLAPWTGTDCDVIPPDVTLPTGSPLLQNHTCSLFGHGHLRTFNELQFNFIHAGEYYVLKSSDTNIYPEVQIRNTYCYDDSICTTAVAIKYKSNTIVIRARYHNNQDTLVWIDGQSFVFDGQVEKDLPDVILKHPTKSEFEITTKSGSNLMVYVRSLDQQLNVIIQTKTPFCKTQDYLCGPCDPATTNVQTYSATWVVEEVHSLFTVIFTNNEVSEKRSVSTAGLCIYFNNSLLTTDFLPDIIISSIDFSIEFSVRPGDNTGVILTYNTKLSFIVYLDVTLKLKIDQNIYDTKINATIEHWHHVSLVWQNVASQMVVYVYKEDGSFEFVSFTVVSQDMFVAYGYFGFGHPPQSPLPTDTEPYHQYFTGDIDEVRVWQKALSYNDILKYQMQRVIITEKSLVTYWKFDDYGSSFIYDLVREHHIQVVDYGILRQTIRWRISSLPLNPPTIPYFHTYTDLTHQQTADSKCTNLIYGSVLGTTNGPTVGVLSFYFAACTSDMAGANNLDMSLSVVVGLSDLYVSSGWSTSWPGAVFCNDFKSLIFPGWVGSDCTQKCDFHESINPTSCACETGYWGLSCNKLCNGGTLNTCGGHGECSQATGDCQCQMNWAAPNCTSCAPGWSGEDCSVSVQSVPTSGKNYLGDISGDGHITTVDGASFRFQEHAIYTFYHYNSISIQIQTGPSRFFHTAVKEIAIKIDAKIVTISTINGGHVAINGQVNSLSTVVDIGSGFQIGPLDSHVYKIYKSGFELVIYVQEDYLNVQLSVSHTYCSSSEGIVGPCSIRPHSCTPGNYACLIQFEGLAKVCTDHVLPSTSITDFIGIWHETYSNSIFKEVNSTYTPSIGLNINMGWVQTVPFQESFIGESTTIETRLKITTLDVNGDGGTVLSYSWRRTFAVCIVNGRFLVSLGSYVVPTGISVQLGQWTQISLVYNSITGWITFHYIYNVEVSVFTSVFIGLEALPPRGTLVIGDWQPPIEGGGSIPPGTFVGTLDRVLVWNRPCIQTQIFIHWKTSVTHNTGGLVAGWNFETGYGKTTLDIVNNYPVTISDTGVAWVAIPDLPDTRTIKPTIAINIGIPETAHTEKCKGLIQSNAFTSQCGSFSESSSFYLMACIEDVSVTGNLDLSMDSTIAFSSVCEVESGLLSSPYQSLCNDFSSRQFPIWKGLECTAKCIFGKFNLDTSFCECNNGYWGTYCDKECPGGAKNPCNGHGTCQTGTGECACQVNWQGDSNCGSCTTGFTGTNCDIQEPELPPNAPMGCLARKHGAYLNFTGHGMTYAEPGNYRMLEMNNLKVEVRSTFCSVFSVIYYF